MKNQLLNRRTLLQSGLVAAGTSLLPGSLSEEAQAAASPVESSGGLKMGENALVS